MVENPRRLPPRVIATCWFSAACGILVDNGACIFAIRHKTPARRHYGELNSLCTNSEYSLYQQKVLCPQSWILRKSHTTSTIGRGKYFTNPTSYPQARSLLCATLARACATVRRGCAPLARTCAALARACATVARPWCIFTNRHRFRPCFEPLFVKMHHLGPPNPNVPINPHRNPQNSHRPLQLQRPLNASGDDQAGIATTKLPAQVVPSQTTRTGSNANAVVVKLKELL